MDGRIFKHYFQERYVLSCVEDYISLEAISNLHLGSL